MCCSHPTSSIYPRLDPVIPPFTASPQPMFPHPHPVRCHLPATVPSLLRCLRPPISRALNLHRTSLHSIGDLVRRFCVILADGFHLHGEFSIRSVIQFVQQIDSTSTQIDSTSTASTSDEGSSRSEELVSGSNEFCAFPDLGAQLNTSYSMISLEARKQILHSGIAVDRIYLSKMASVLLELLSS
ncbi:hypothetical protein EJB05_26776 [Eragrostis curvula]|uniref:Uncharacterized protein n=1 Tax=Eragrostis curvula TaxID=38414 RepID=A0A5J9ULM8_9POAL|nr:hypothetical protein EJB05_26776 [Eragrostis curvula]